MTALTKLLAEYEKDLAVIHENRATIKDRLGKNRVIRMHLESVKGKMLDLIATEMTNGKSLYQICLTEFGSVDRRFHVLFSLFRGKE